MTIDVLLFLMTMAVFLLSALRLQEDQRELFFGCLDIEIELGHGDLDVVLEQETDDDSQRVDGLDGRMAAKGTGGQYAKVLVRNAQQLLQLL